MRKLALAPLLGLLVATACLGQGAVPSPRLLPLARVMDAMMDMEVLGKIAPLALTDEQLLTLSAVYKQYPLEAFNVAAAQEGAEKLEQLRARLIAGVVMDMGAEQAAIQKILEGAFSEFNHSPQTQDRVTAWTPQESLIGATLTAAQKAVLRGGGGDDRSNQGACKRALEVIGQLRGKEAPVWTISRDRLAASLAAAAGAEGTPARENTRQMFVDFLDRLRRMSEADFAAKQKELSAELLALLPPGASLALLLADFDLSQTRNALRWSLLSPRAPALVQEMQAVRAKQPGQ